MDADRFDTLSRSLTAAASRRGLLHGVVSAAMGLGITFRQSPIAAKKKSKIGPLNAFGCLNVGQKCSGHSDLCCSGICAGKKPKKGEKDKRTCVAHNTGGCVVAQDICASGQAAVCGKTIAFCARTTGEAGFCALVGVGKCVSCTKDADCFLYGPGAACVEACPSICGQSQSTTACVVPAAD